MEALDKAIRLSRKTGRPEPPKKIPRTYEDIDERELKIIDRLAAMTVEERLRFNNYQSKSRKFIKDTKSLEQVLLSHINFSNIAGIANDSLQETLELISGYSSSKSALWSAETLSKEQQTDVDSKQSELNERLQKVNRAMERLKKVYLFSDDGMDEKEFLEMKSSLEADRVKIENEIKGLSTPIATNVDQVAFIKSASEFLLMHKINSGEFVDYKELATLDEESLKQFMNSVIDHIVVRERKIVEIVFTNGLSHTLLYK